MFNKKVHFIIAILFFGSFWLQSQECSLVLEGKVQDEETGQILPFVNVVIQENTRGKASNEQGEFSFDKLCSGHYHLTFSHIGCEPVVVHVDLKTDTVILIKLSHHPTSLAGANVTGRAVNSDKQSTLVVNRQSIEDQSNKNLASLLENESGVHLIQNGNGIAKPVVQGLYGNRLAVLNNGIIQSGQQWGNDHSPEIDPFSADKVIVLKGVSAITYGGGNMGNAVLIEPKSISKDPHLHGQVGYVFESNGRGNTLNFRLEKYSPKIAWRIGGSLKKYGDKKTASYFLNNSGTEEGNLSIQLEKSWREKVSLEIYGSTFNTRLGILRGSQIGNLTDLELAFDRTTPFYTEEQFSYQIDAPKQQVSHHFLKVKTSYFFSDTRWLEATLAGQLNQRKEFDVRRSGRSSIPSLSLSQFTINAEFKYTQDLNKNWRWKIGNQNISTDNTNNPETGILPLIPDYYSLRTGIYSTLSKKFNRLGLEWGIRYDYEYQNVAAISTSLPRKIEYYRNNFQNVSALFAMNYSLEKNQKMNFNVGYSMRNPAINELYSRGLHQGVGGIEEGDVNLKTERAVKGSFAYEWLPNKNFSFEGVSYAQYFQNYIFLNPEDEVRLTIRGAFPVFSYKQTQALIFGVDLSSRFTIANSIFGAVNYSFLRGMDLEQDIPLVFMPPNSLFGSLSYRTKKIMKLTSKLKIEDIEFEVNNRFVFKQNYLNADQDFVAPPPGYNLLGAKISANVSSSKMRYRVYIQADNILNVAYRDYLNRQRYFADDLGYSITLGVQMKF